MSESCAPGSLLSVELPALENNAPSSVLACVVRAIALPDGQWSLGCTFAAELTDLTIGFCIDTCHCHSSGYDVATAAGVKQTVAEIDRVLGIDNVKVIHANDSKTQLGSHVDRHEHIGHGYIGEEGFRRILNHPKLHNKAFILETPNDNAGDEARNIETLKKLCRKSSTTSSR